MLLSSDFQPPVVKKLLIRSAAIATLGKRQFFTNSRPVIEEGLTKPLLCIVDLDVEPLPMPLRNMHKITPTPWK